MCRFDVSPTTHHVMPCHVIASHSIVLSASYTSMCHSCNGGIHAWCGGALHIFLTALCGVPCFVVLCCAVLPIKTGFYAVLPNAKEATRALQVVRQEKSWKGKVMTYAEYWHSKHNSSNGSSNGSGSQSVVVRAAPPPLATPASAGNKGDVSSSANVVQEMLVMAQQMQRRAAAAKQQKQDEARQQQQQHMQASGVDASLSAAEMVQQEQQPPAGQAMQLGIAGPVQTSATTPAPAGEDGDGSNSSNSGKQTSDTGGPQSHVDDGDGVRDAADKRRASLESAAQRLQRLGSMASPLGSSALQRPALRRPPPPPPPHV